MQHFEKYFVSHLGGRIKQVTIVHFFERTYKHQKKNPNPGDNQGLVYLNVRNHGSSGRPRVTNRPLSLWPTRTCRYTKSTYTR